MIKTVMASIEMKYFVRSQGKYAYLPLRGLILVVVLRTVSAMVSFFQP